MIRITIAFILVSCFMTNQNYGAPSSLGDFRWKHRIILLQAVQESEGKWVAMLRANAAAIEERDILWFVFGDESLETNFPGQLASDFNNGGLEARYFGKGLEPIVLIGKDGDAKVWQSSLKLEALFSRIDAMPMRRAEMREGD